MAADSGRLPAHGRGGVLVGSQRSGGTDVDSRGSGRADDHSAVEVVARLGLVLYGVVHLLFAYVAIRVVLTDASGSTTGSGVLSQLARDTTGRVTLGVVGVGFAALVLWQGITAVVGYRDSPRRTRYVLRVGALARAAVYAYFAYGSVRRALTGPSGSGGSPDSASAQLLSAPGGAVVLAGIGVTIAGVGVGLVVYGVLKKFLEQLDHAARNHDRRAPIVLLGQVGYVAKGIAFLVVGGLFCWAAASHDPKKSGGLDAALVELLGRSLGRPAIVVVAVGIAVFGVYTLIRSRHIQSDSLTSSAAR
jgi:hypothetical protein